MDKKPIIKKIYNNKNRSGIITDKFTYYEIDDDPLLLYRVESDTSRIDIIRYKDREYIRTKISNENAKFDINTGSWVSLDGGEVPEWFDRIEIDAIDYYPKASWKNIWTY